MFQRSKPEKTSRTPKTSTNPSNPAAEATVAASPTQHLSVRSDDETVITDNTPEYLLNKPTDNVYLKTIADLQLEVKQTKAEVTTEKAAKRKLYSSLVKLATELKRIRAEHVPLLDAAEFANQSWYKGGMWRAPKVLPGLNQRAAGANQKHVLQKAIGLSELFFDLVVVTAFTRVGTAIATNSTVNLRDLLYFAIFWMIWTKETNYSTRFDVTDLSVQIVTLLTCFATLFASLSTNSEINSVDGTRIMMAAAFVAILHCMLHIRVACWYKGAVFGSVNDHVQRYAIFTVIMTFLETVTWTVGIFFLPEDYPYRWAILLTGIAFSIRLPRAFLSNDFHAACSKRGVLFILLLGFLLQSVVIVGSPFFEYQTPSLEQYGFLGSCCLMLFCIKLLYVDDNTGALGNDHALLVNRYAGLFFNIGQLTLLLATTVLGAGLDLMTHSYLAATQALSDNAKILVCGGFSSVVLSIAFIKSMHLRRFPVAGKARALFVAAYLTQLITTLLVVTITAVMCLRESYIMALTQDERIMMFVLAGMAAFLVVMSWLDEAVELSLYKGADDASQYLVNPFGLWWCLKPELNEVETLAAAAEPGDRRLSALSPLLGASMADFKLSVRNFGYDSISEDMDAMQQGESV